MADIVWTESAKKLLHPRRGYGDVPAPVDAKAVRTRLAAMVEKLPADATDEIRTLAKAHFAEGRALDADQAAAVATLPLPRRSASDPSPQALFVDHFARGAGLAFAVSVTARLSSWIAQSGGTGDKLRVVRGAGRPPLSSPNVEAWIRLREHVARANDAEHAAAVRVADQIRADSSNAPSLRAAIAFAFPDRPEWAAEAARAVIDLVRQGQLVPHWAPHVCASLADAELAATLLALPVIASPVRPFLVDVVAGIGARAARLIAPLYDGNWNVDNTIWATALSVIDDPAAAAALTQRLEQKDVKPIAAEYFVRFPHLAESVLAPLVGNKRTGTAATILTAAQRANETFEEAALDELPEVLRDPPWRRAKSKSGATKAPSSLASVAPIAMPERIVWGPDEKPKVRRGALVLSDDVARAHLRDGVVFLNDLDRASDVVALEALEHVPIVDMYTYQPAREVRHLLARFDLAALPAVLRYAEKKPTEALPALLAVASPRVAPLMARALVRTKRARNDAERWLIRHAELAAVTLVPAALGGKGKGADAAAVALRLLAARGREADVRAAAARYGDGAAAAIEALLATGPLLTGLPARAPKMPDFWKAAHLPRPRLRESGKALPLDAVEHLGAMLAFTSHDLPYAGIADVKAACTPGSLADFAWALFETWMLSGAPSKEDWAFFALGHLGDDECARKLAPLMRAWPTEGAFARAVTGLDVLATFGSDVALMLLHGISQKVKSKPLQNAAREKMEAIAETLGLDPEELADRLVPDLGLDEDGSRWLGDDAPGERRFRVGFDEHLRPFVKDEDGTQYAELTKSASAEATRTWKDLKKLAKTVGAAQLARLEQAMVTRRRWTLADFDAVMVKHPLLGHLVRRLVWGAWKDAALVGTFRVAEDGTFADAEDAAYALPEGAQVGIVHPIDLDEATRARWGQVLSEYEILQPFAQLGRETYAPSPEEREQLAVTRVATKVVPALKVYALDRNGWRRGQVEDGGAIHVYEKEVGPYRAVLPLEPGLYLGDPTMTPEQTLGEVHVYAGEQKLSVCEMDAALFSEIARDLALLMR